MNRLTLSASLSIAIVSFVAAAPAATLKVGPGKQFTKPSQAIQAAKDGDTIEVDSGTYSGDVATIRANHLTIRGVGDGRAKLAADGKDVGGKGIWVVTGSDLTVENVEFSGARVRDRNGAGIRPEGKNLTVRNCRFYDCQNGVLGGNGEMLFEGCEFAHCGPVADPATHSLYIGQGCTKLVFRHNYSTDVIEGHLLKSRAKESWLLYNRLTDENGSGSAVADFPNGGVVVVIGNLMHKGARGNNSRVIAYGMEGIKHAKNALCVVNNTIVYEHRHNSAFFVQADNRPEGFVPIIRNNLCIGKVPLTNATKADAAGNVLLKTVAEARLANAASYDYRLAAGSPAIGKGVAAGKFGDFDLTPIEEYVHPCKSQPRPAADLLDVGAYQWRKK
ncbi:MAG: right-handed parallel beta-helix repeat-containing protein [Pirellulales bacterium]